MQAGWDVTFVYSITDGTTSSGDYVALGDLAARTITIDAGQTVSRPYITITTVPDEIDEDDETFTLAIVAPGGTVATAVFPTVTGTIENDDLAVSIVAGRYLAGEPMVPYTIMSDSATRNALEVSYQATYGTGGVGDILTETIPQGQEEVTIMVPFANPAAGATGTQTAVAIVDGLHYVPAATGASADLPTPIQGSQPLVSISRVGPEKVFESAEFVDFNLTIAPANSTSTKEVVIVISQEDLEGGTLTTNGDFISRAIQIASDNTQTVVSTDTSAANEVTKLEVRIPIAIDDTSASFRVEFASDTIGENDAKITAEIQDGGSNYITSSESNSAFVNVFDEDREGVIPEISFGDITLNGVVATTELAIVEGQLVEIEINSAFPIPNANGLEVHYSVVIPTGDNFIALPTDTTIANFDTYIDGSASNPSVTIPAGQDSVTIRIQTVEDEIEEANGSFTLTLLADTPSGTPTPSLEYNLGEPANSSRTITITDDDPLLTIAAVQADGTISIEEGTHSTNTTPLSIEVAIENAEPAAETITVDYRTAPIDPTTTESSVASASDFTETTGTLTFQSGSNNALSIVIPIIADALDEETEIFSLSLEVTAGGARLQHSEITIQITDDDDGTNVII